MGDEKGACCSFNLLDADGPQFLGKFFLFYRLPDDRTLLAWLAYARRGSLT